MSTTDTEPTTRAVAVAKRGLTTYALHLDGSLWVRGKYGYRAGYVSDPDNLEHAADMAEEELAHLMAELA